MIKRLLVCVLALAALCGCSKEPSLELDPGQSFVVGAEGGTVKISFTARRDWTAELVDPQASAWMGISPTSGKKGSAVITVSVSGNADYEDRSAALTISSNGKTETVTVSQKQKDAILPKGDSVKAPVDGGVFDIKLESNVDYKVGIDADWISSTTSKALVSYTHSFKAEPLPENISKRTANISFTDAQGVLSKTVSVVQESPRISFQTTAVKTICVEKWDKNGDGELSEREAAAVTTLDLAFQNNKSIKSFDELAYFTGLTEILSEEFYNCISLKSITIPEGVKIIGKQALAECTSLQQIKCLPSVPPECGMRLLYSSASKATIIVPKGKASIYQEAESWMSLAARITEEGHEPKEFFYCSTDYSMDGEVLCLQKATKGNGLDLVFLGDGYVDKDLVPGGRFETQMSQWMEYFFSYEPYATFREWFNVYLVKVVSKNRVYGSNDSERTLTETFTNGHITAKYAACHKYAEKAPRSRTDRPWTAVFANCPENAGTDSFCAMAPGSCDAFILDGFNYRPSVLIHELGGHGIAHLADEYPEGNPGAPDNPKTFVESYHNIGYWYNVDWRNNIRTVRWSRFIADSRYASEQLGIFEGAGTYPAGIYRSTENSMMRDDFAPGIVFNPPSRETIYQNIMRWGVGEDWKYDYETFVAVDEAGRKQAKAFANAARTAVKHGPMMPEELRKPDRPPFFVDESVREILISPDGQISFIY